jgi:type VI secretion system protein ImpJ
VLNKNLRLSFGGEPLDGKVVMRLARIRRASDGKPCLDSDFAPALLTLASSPRLEKAMRELVTRLAARTQSMRKERFERTGQVMDFNRDDVRSYWYLHTLNQSLPVLEQLLKCPQLHPYTLYLELLRLSGGLLSFHSDAAQDIPDYNHEAPLQTFMALEAVLARQLEVMIVHRYERIDFTRDGEFSIATIKDPGLVRSGELVMVIPGSHRPDALRELERGLKIADIDSIDRVVARWLTGIPFQRVEALPASFPKAGEGIYLKLQRDQEFWPRISGTGQLAAFLPRSFATAQPYLIGVRGQTA